jgi:ribosomal protein L29
MMKSEQVSEQFTMALNHLDQAESILHKIAGIEMGDHDALNRQFVILTDMVEDLHYQVCAPMAMDEEETLAKIQKMEEELFNLRASLRA